MKNKPSPAAIRAAEKIIHIHGTDSGVENIAELIDRETGGLVKMKSEPSAGALKAAKEINHKLVARSGCRPVDGHTNLIAHIIDRESGLKELIEVCSRIAATTRPEPDLQENSKEIKWSDFVCLKNYLAKARGTP